MNKLPDDQWPVVTGGRRVDIGVASYRNPEKLARTLESIRTQTRGDWQCFIVHNPSSGDEGVRDVIRDTVTRYGPAKFMPVYLESNRGYAGAVNEILQRAETEYVLYCDNDIEILTPGWDEQFCGLLDRHHEVGMVFPNGGPYQIDRGNYQEVLWGVGFCWGINRLAMKDTGSFDEAIGHQNEPDYCMRLRMAGWRCAALPGVQVRHDATATNDPAQIERINRGVVQFVDKWNRYFNGKNFSYHSPNVTRWHDWPPNALYLEEWFRLQGVGTNAAPRIMAIGGEMFDMCEVPRLANFYRGRII
jgi:GT2 family glycosyltransferase